ncbi:hypothetical protein [Nocardia carnea]|uniref:hypothetical protein n=1 Tax=Nocardia carnea TaxID=37328 RepID=UPI002457E0B4|nr:hypothetical protein [Nocardia carnea]
MFCVVELDDWIRGESDPSGDEAKRWFRAPEQSPLVGHWLFKPRTEKVLPLSKKRQALGHHPDVLIGGENWAEKIAFELARLIAIPAAETELATAPQTTDSRRVWGSISRDMRPEGWSWAPGAQLLAEVDSHFDEKFCVGHTLEAVRDVLDGISGPYGGFYMGWSAFDVWVSYLLLDAWIGNTDRHAHNWGVVQHPATGDIYLGPSFDHGTSLASGETDDRRATRVEEGSVTVWCARGRTKRFYGGEPHDLVDLATRALSMCSAAARQHWVGQLIAVDLDECRELVERVPRMSDHTCIFVQTAITLNRKRLCDALH